MGGLPGLVPISLAVTLVAKAGLLAMACASVAGWGRWADRYAFGGGGGGGGGGGSELPLHMSQPAGLPALAGLGATAAINADGDGGNGEHGQLAPIVPAPPLMETVFGLTAVLLVVGLSLLVSELGGLVVSWLYWYGDTGDPGNHFGQLCDGFLPACSKPKLPRPCPVHELLYL